MSDRHHRLAFAIVFSCSVTALVILVTSIDQSQPLTVPLPVIDTSVISSTTFFVLDTPIKPNPVIESILFLGDMMLARQVERINQAQGLGYSFLKADFLSWPNQYVIANFEAAVPAVHVPTPDFGFLFSVPETHLGPLQAAGLTHVGLANNHTYDFGGVGYDDTVSALREASLVPFGHPTISATSSIEFLELRAGTVAVIPLHTLYRQPTVIEVEALVTYAQGQSDYQVVYVHWGNEYQLRPSAAQRQLASTLARLKVDAVIGHHPHVTQSIERIDNTLVFYSLGNFIFDQYFSTDVQQGLAVRLTPTTDRLEFTLLPHTSLSSRVQPRLMSDLESVDFLTALASRSTESLATGILASQLELATSGEIVMMAP